MKFTSCITVIAATSAALISAIAVPPPSDPSTLMHGPAAVPPPSDPSTLMHGPAGSTSSAYYPPGTAVVDPKADVYYPPGTTVVAPYKAPEPTSTAAPCTDTPTPTPEPTCTDIPTPTAIVAPISNNDTLPAYAPPPYAPASNATLNNNVALKSTNSAGKVGGMFAAIVGTAILVL